MQPIEDVMATTRSFGEGDQAYTEVYTHCAGVPIEMIEQAKAIVAVRKESRKRATLREAYTEAVVSLLDAIRAGEDIAVVATAKTGGKDVHFWLRDDLTEELAEACRKLDRRKNVVFVTALGRWLERERRLN
jgi:hypothetical protein